LDAIFDAIRSIYRMVGIPCRGISQGLLLPDNTASACNRQWRQHVCRLAG
jgi:hypothetical protein